MENEILRILPQTVRAVLLHTPESRIEELRLRVGQKPSVLYAGCEQILNAGGVLTQNELQQVLLNASAQSQYAVQEQLRNGYLSLPGGYRIGVCGSTVGAERLHNRNPGNFIHCAPRSARHPGNRQSGCFRICRNPVCLPVHPEAGKQRYCAAASERFQMSGQRVGRCG